MRYSVHSVREIMPHIYPGSPKIKLGEHEVKTSTTRLLTYTKGIKCVKCGIEASFFAVEDNGSKPHLNLYGYRNDNEMLMTSDHIVPKSKAVAMHLAIDSACVRNVMRRKKINWRNKCS